MKSIKQTAYISGVISICAVSAAGIVGTWSAYRATVETRDMAASMALVQRHMESDMKHDAIRGDIAGALAGRDAASGISIADQRKAAEQDMASFSKSLEEAKALSTHAETSAALNELDRPLQAYFNGARHMLDVIQHDPANAAAQFPAFDKSFLALQDAMDKASDAIENYNNRQTEQARSEILINLYLVCLFAFLAAGVAFYVMQTTRKRVAGPLSDTATAVEAMAAGDYDVVVPGADRADELGKLARAVEIFRTTSREKAVADAQQAEVVNALAGGLSALAAGDLTHRITQTFAGEYDRLRTAFNETIDNLGTTLVRVARSASSVRNGAGEIRAASDDLAQRTEQQAASLEEAAAAMSQATAMVQETARSAVEVNGSIEEAHREATKGGDVVERAVRAMGAIEQSSQEIGQIISLIDGIAFQTNLLALNAGVEAARAGDAGKGFAVVASEVRALAQRSAEAAKEIKDLVTQSATQVSEGVNLVGETGTMLDSIVVRVGDISQLITAISHSAKVQATGLQQINGTVGEMDKMTQQNAAMVEESTAAARSLATEADELARLVAGFTLEQGNGTPAAAPTRLYG